MFVEAHQLPRDAECLYDLVEELRYDGQSLKSQNCYTDRIFRITLRANDASLLIEEVTQENKSTTILEPRRFSIDSRGKHEAYMEFMRLCYAS
jgi:hypothetical protein